MSEREMYEGEEVSRWGGAAMGRAREQSTFHLLGSVSFLGQLLILFSSEEMMTWL